LGAARICQVPIGGGNPEEWTRMLLVGYDDPGPRNANHWSLRTIGRRTLATSQRFGALVDNGGCQIDEGGGGVGVECTHTQWS